MNQMQGLPQAINQPVPNPPPMGGPMGPMGHFGATSQTPPPPSIPDIDPAQMASMLSGSVFHQAQNPEQMIRSIEARKFELHAYLRSWLAMSMSHRRANYEDKWNRWRRNTRNIYDPARKARKEKWQNVFFVPLTMQNKEVIKGGLFRTLVAGLPFSVKPRPSGNQDEAFNIQVLILRECERTKLEIASNDCFDDLTTYGTMFMKTYHKITVARRSMRQPIYKPLTMADMHRIRATGQPPQPIGYKTLPATPQVTYKGVSCEFVSIWDMFFGSNAKSMKDPHAQRYKMSLQEIIDGVAAGWAFPESVDKMRNVIEPASPPPDLQVQMAEREPSTIATPKQVNERDHTCYEWWGVLPKRLVYLRPDDQNLIDNPEELVPVKALFSNESLVAVDPNEDRSADSPFLTTGYLHVPGSIYHIGVAEMMEQIQDSINEDTNQRKDNVQLILNRMGVILEKAIVSRADLVSRPGGMIRIKQNSTDDVSKAFQWVESPDVTRSSYQETQDAERFSQELTGASKISLGSGNAKDITETKGGMQIIQQSSNDRLMYYSQLIEADWSVRLVKRIYSLIYQYADPNDIQKILGPQRAAFFQMRSPEDLDQDYYFEPQGVFNAARQPVRIQQWQAFRDQYAGAPFFDDFQMAMEIAQAIELPGVDKILCPMRDPQTGLPIPFPMLQQMALLAQQAAGLPQDPSGPGKAGRPGTQPKLATRKAGRNGPITKGGPAAPGRGSPTGPMHQAAAPIPYGR